RSRLPRRAFASPFLNHRWGILSLCAVCAEPLKPSCQPNPPKGTVGGALRGALGRATPLLYLAPPPLVDSILGGFRRSFGKQSAGMAELRFRSGGSFQARRGFTLAQLL